MERRFECSAGVFDIDDVTFVPEQPNAAGDFAVRLEYGKYIALSALDRLRLMRAIDRSAIEMHKRTWRGVEMFFQNEAATLDANQVRAWMLVLAGNMIYGGHTDAQYLLPRLSGMGEGEFLAAVQSLVDRKLIIESTYDFDNGPELLWEAFHPSMEQELLSV